MKNVKPLLLITFMLIFLFSCKKDVIEINEEDPYYVYAGIYDSSFYYQEFSPSMAIDLIWDNENLYGFGKDSIDIDNNGTFDLSIELSVLNEDSLHLITGYPNPFPYCWLDNNDIETALYTESYYVGLGQSSTTTFANALDYGTRIDSIPEWGIPNSYVKMWNENPNTGPVPPFGKWYYANAIKYLGVKINNKHGWVEIDATNPKNPIITKSAIQL